MKNHRKNIRLRDWDYSSVGYYFITICTDEKQPVFGEIMNGIIHLNECGEIIKYTWFDLINHNHNILLDHFVILPDHIHGIIIITNVGAGSKPAPNATKYADDTTKVGLEPAPILNEIIRQFKTFSARRINKLRNSSSIKLWQRNYYDHIIRNEQSLHDIRKYIDENPKLLNPTKDEALSSTEY